MQKAYMLKVEILTIKIFPLSCNELCMKKTFLLCCFVGLLQICGIRDVQALGLFEGKFGASVGLSMEQRKGEIIEDSTNSVLVQNGGSLFKKVNTGFYIGAGYNVYLNLLVVKPFVGFDLRYTQPFSNNAVIKKDDVNVKFREWGSAHIKAGLRVNFIGLQPYVLFGTNYSRINVLYGGRADKDKYGGFGYSVGAGLEWMFLSIVGLRLEYRHTINKQAKDITVSGFAVPCHAKIRANNVSLGAVVYI